MYVNKHVQEFLPGRVLLLITPAFYLPAELIMTLKSKYRYYQFRDLFSVIPELEYKKQGEIIHLYKAVKVVNAKAIICGFPTIIAEYDPALKAYLEIFEVIDIFVNFPYRWRKQVRKLCFPLVNHMRNC